TAAYWRGSTSASASTSVSGALGLISIPSLDGLNVAPVAGATVLSDAALETHYRSLDGAFRFRSDYKVTPALTISPPIGVGASGTKDLSDFKAVLTPPAGAATAYTSDETLTARRLGGEIGADASWRLGESWVLHGGASFGLFSQRTALDGNDCAGAASGPNNLCTGTVFGTKVEQVDVKTGWRVGMTAGATYSLGWMQISAMGVGAYDNAVPGTRHPTIVNQNAPV